LNLKFKFLQWRKATNVGPERLTTWESQNGCALAFMAEPTWPPTRGAPPTRDEVSSRSALDAARRAILEEKQPGKKSGRGLPGGKAELRAARIAQKRAARATIGGAAFDASAFMATLLAAEALADGGAGGEPLRHASPPLSEHARRTAERVARLLGWDAADSGGGGRHAKRAVVFSKPAGASCASESALAEVRALCGRFAAELTGAAVEAVVDAQRAARRKRRDKRAKEAAEARGAGAGRGAGRFVGASSGSDGSDGSDPSDGSEEDEDKVAEGAWVAAAEASPRIAFVKEGGPESSGGGGGGGGGGAGLWACPACGPDNPAGAECGTCGTAPSDGGGAAEEGGTGLGFAAEGSLAAQFMRLSVRGGEEGGGGVGAAISPVPPAGGASGAEEEEAAATAAAAPWEAHTKGFGSRMLQKLGFRGGHLGRRPGLGETQPPPHADAANEERKVGKNAHLGLGAARL
jgi:hypothetical protein